MNGSISGYDQSAYGKAIEYISRLSRLYSTSDHSYIVYRFAEKLFCATTGAEDLASKDISFDARLRDAGVGIKTFIANNPSIVKREKVAEFTKDASSGAFIGLPHAELARRVSELRNARVSSDAAEIGVDLSKSFYHCLVRFPGFAKVFEEPYELIDTANISPITMSGVELEAFESKNNGTVYFSDGKNKYQFLTAKNTLVKSFDLGHAFLSEDIPTPIFENIWEEVLGTTPRVDAKVVEALVVPESEDEGEEDFVILPLYSTQRKDLKEVPTKSGINQWNAGGRLRSFGEAYIPVPMAVHKQKPGFFPARDQKFELRLPNGQVVIAKLCQDNSKALMSDPNDQLCRWLFSTIDGSWSIAEKRLAESRPYTYDDLLEIDKDCVKIRRDVTTGMYFLDSARVGDYEKYTLGESSS